MKTALVIFGIVLLLLLTCIAVMLLSSSDDPFDDSDGDFIDFPEYHND
ncbi:MAG: hypothetical protein LBL57_06875 [Tannerella sp.]|nr:hypothetical protein [Tannerella sp.]